MKNKLILALFSATIVVSVLFVVTIYQNSTLQLSRLGYVEKTDKKVLIGNNLEYEIPDTNKYLKIKATDGSKQVLYVGAKKITCKNGEKACTAENKEKLEELVYSSQVNKTIYLRSLEILNINNNELTSKTSAENNSLISPLSNDQIKMYHTAYSLGYRFNKDLVINYYDSNGEIKAKKDADYSEVSDIMSLKTKTGNSFVFTNSTVHYIPKTCSNDKEVTCGDLIISSGSDELRTGTPKLKKEEYADILDNGADQKVFEKSVKMIGNSPKKVIKNLEF